MKLITKTTEYVHTETSVIETESGNFTLIDYYNQKGKIIDSCLRDELGNNCEDPILFEEITEFLDQI